MAESNRIVPCVLECGHTSPRGTKAGAQIMCWWDRCMTKRRIVKVGN